MKRSAVLCVLLFTISLDFFAAGPGKNEVPWKDYVNDPRIDSIMNSMTMREMIGQLIWIPVWAGEKNNYCEAEQMVRTYGIGGIIFFEGKLESQVDFTRRIKAVSKIPLIVVQDAEWGTGMRLDEIEDFPYQMTLGAVQNDSLLYRMGEAVARQCREIGVGLNLAPVADVNNNPANPVINYRSFGEDPQKVAAKASMYMKGMQDNGIIACAKHFPGHGDTDIDSHTGLPVIRGDRQRFGDVELVPFRLLADEGIGAVMSAHINVPDIDPTPKLPSTFSKTVITDILRNEIGFSGLVLTDAMNMAGATMTYPAGIAEAEALEAGNDIIEFAPDPVKAIEEISMRVTKGEIAASEIKARCRKLLAAKLWLEATDKQKPVERPAGPSTDADRALIRDLYAGAMTLIENRNNIIPIGRLDRVRVATVAVNRLSETEFQKMVSRYTDADHYYIDPANPQSAEYVFASLAGYDVVISGICAPDQRTSTSIKMTPGLDATVSRLAAMKGSVILWFGSPYDIAKLSLPEKPSAMIVAYQNNSYTQQMAVQVVFGGVGAAGKLPVTINESYPEGYGLITTGGMRLQYGYPENAAMSSSLLVPKVDSIIRMAIDSLAFPGCQVLIARNGTVVMDKCYGYHFYDSTEAVTEDDLWDLASVTKVSAGTASLMLLYDRGLFDPDKTLGYYLPWYRHSDKSGIVMRDMLAHQGGLTPFIPFWRNTLENDSTFKAGIFSTVENKKYSLPVTDSMYINKRYTREMFREIRDSKMGPKKYRYSDLTFILAAEVVESLTDTTIDRFAPANIYRPIGAFNITYNPLQKYSIERIVPTEYDSLFRKQLIRGTVHDEGAAMLGGVSGHAGLFATGNDLMKLAEMYRRGGEYGGVRVLSSAVLKEFSRVQFADNDNKRGLGFDKPTLGNDTVPEERVYPARSASPSSFGHSGFTGTFIWVDPEAGLTYVFMSNRVYPTRDNNMISDLSVRGTILQAAYDSMTDRKTKNENTQ